MVKKGCTFQRIPFVCIEEDSMKIITGVVLGLSLLVVSFGYVAECQGDEYDYPREHEEWGGHIKVISATYGSNCGAPYGNATNDLARVCDGKGSCEYVIDVRVLGDPAKGCPKDYVAEWKCGRDPKSGTVGARAEAGTGTPIVLKCPIERRRENDRY